MGTEYYSQYILKNNMVSKPYPFVVVPSLPDDLLVISNRINDILSKTCFEMFMSANQAEFDASWAELCKNMESIGLDKLQEWYSTIYPEAKAKSAQYMK